MLKRFLIWLIKNILIILLGTLIFSTIALNLPDFVTRIFGDVYSYSSPEAKSKVVSSLAEACSSSEQGQGVVTLAQICSNATLLRSMRKNCNDYRQAKEQGMQIENEQQVAETCRQIEPPEIEKSCSQMKGNSNANFSRSIGDLCRDYRSGRINDKQFFSGFIGLYTGSQNMQMPKIRVLESYDALINYLNRNKLIYLVIFLILIGLLYFIINDLSLFMTTIAGMIFSLGVLVMLPYFGIIAYQYFVGFDTTPILMSMFSLNGAINPKAILSVILLLFLRTYSNFIITVGFIFLIAGGIGKIYWRKAEKKKK